MNVSKFYLGNQKGSVQKVSVNALQIPTGTILAYAGTVAPAGFQLCDGSPVVSESLRILIGDNTPDMRQSTPVGHHSASNSYSVLGQAFGNNFQQINRIPSHQHSLGWGGSIDANSGEFDRKVYLPNWNSAQYSAGNLKNKSGPGNFLISIDTSSDGVLPMGFPNATSINGRGFYHDNRQPFHYVNFIIKL